MKCCTSAPPTPPHSLIPTPIPSPPLPYAPTTTPSQNPTNPLPSITDATGPPTATSALLIIYDIFGFSPQALQGADILAHADDEHHQYRVFVPDFFLGKPLPHSDFPPDTDEKKKKVGEFFAGPAEPGATAKKVMEVVKKIEGTGEGKGVQKWGSLGMCWGGKVSSFILPGWDG